MGGKNLDQIMHICIEGPDTLNDNDIMVVTMYL